MDIEWDIDLDGEVATHGTDATTIDVFEATEVRLIGLIKEVLTDERNFDAVVATEVDIGAEGEGTDGVVGGGCLGVFEGEEVILSEDILHAESDA